MDVFFGDLHNHCGITYGFGSLENALKVARTHLDFTSITGHAMWPDIPAKNEDTAFIVDFHEKGFEKLRENWTDIRKQIAQANTDGLVTFQGYEMHSSAYGDHHLVSPSDDLKLVYRETPNELVRDCGAQAIAVPHHIAYVPGYRGINWDSFDETISPIVEVYSKHGCSMHADSPYPYYHNMGPRDPRNTVEQGLKRLKCFSFVASTDHHAGFPGSYGDGLAAIWAEEKTRESLWNAILKGRTYAVTGDRIRGFLKVNDAWMGETISTSRRTVTCHIEGDSAIKQVRLYRNGECIRCENGKFSKEKSTRFKLRIEMGWGNHQESFKWDGRLQIENGRIIRGYPCLRGKSVLSPTEMKGKNPSEDINAMDNQMQ